MGQLVRLIYKFPWMTYSGLALETRRVRNISMWKGNCGAPRNCSPSGVSTRIIAMI